MTARGHSGAPLRAIQPVHWAGMQKGGPDSPMVCGACPDWNACAEANRCDRATDEDYARSRFFGGGGIKF